jgi:hypothetical protein
LTLKTRIGPQDIGHSYAPAPPLSLNTFPFVDVNGAAEHVVPRFWQRYISLNDCFSRPSGELHVELTACGNCPDERLFFPATTIFTLIIVEKSTPELG